MAIFTWSPNEKENGQFWSKEPTLTRIDQFQKEYSSNPKKVIINVETAINSLRWK